MTPGPSRPATRIVGAVVVVVALLVALAAWVVVAPYDECDSGAVGGTAAEAACEDARATRRTTALLVGAGLVTAAAAVSTWPSRRLTGEALGPEGE